MNANARWRRSTCLLMLIVFFEMLKTSLGQDLTAENVRRLARQAFDEGRYSDAERELRLALQTFVKDANAFEVAQTLGDLSGVFAARARYSEAEQLLNRAVSIIEAMPHGFEAHSSEASRLLDNLAAVYQLTSRFQLAESTFNRALRLLEEYKPSDPHMVVVLSNLGTLYVQIGKYKQASKYLMKGLNLAEKRLAVDHPDFLPVLTNLAALYERQKEWARAESYLIRAAAIAKHSLRPGHPEGVVIIQHLGVVHYRQGKLQEAEMELRRALDIQEAAFAAESVRRVSMSLSLAKVLTAQRRFDEARILYSDVLPVQELLLGSKAPEVATTLEDFAKLLHTMKTHKSANELEARAKRIRAELAYTRSVKDSRQW
jgi:tetratricopeptide (TPR) repeat protein